MSQALDVGLFFHGTKADLRDGEVTDWTRQTPGALRAWKERLAVLREDERGEIIN